eukprot:TRINITY_DN47553_c0_g1_i1.p2 TRINITY_DN47553_c0_g1~~TRINITY_DN47553_c0_g1_i1.p2  ORF type:complete len:213 (+),score=81.19 TRINITY_DN47553_c0_g1_i1:81-641(+)
MLRSVARAAAIAAHAPVAQVAVPARGLFSVAFLHKQIAAAKRRGDAAAAAKARRKLPAARQAEAARALTKAAGPIAARRVFLAKELKRQRQPVAGMKAASAKWAAMTPAEKQPFEIQAARNRALLAALRAEQARRRLPKKAPTPWAAFVKAHFAAAYKSALATAKKPADAFKVATAEVAAKWKAQK